MQLACNSSSSHLDEYKGEYDGICVQIESFLNFDTGEFISNADTTLNATIKVTSFKDSDDQEGQIIIEASNSCENNDIYYMEMDEIHGDTIYGTWSPTQRLSYSFKIYKQEGIIETLMSQPNLNGPGGTYTKGIFEIK